MKSYCIAAAIALAVSACLPAAALADDCANRGQLDEAYCDANKDLVADIPAKTRDPEPSPDRNRIVTTHFLALSCLGLASCLRDPCAWGHI